MMNSNKGKVHADKKEEEEDIMCVVLLLLLYYYYYCCLVVHEIWLPVNAQLVPHASKKISYEPRHAQGGGKKGRLAGKAV